MTMSSTLWGAGLACALGGAIAGTALGSTPVIGDRHIVGSYYQTHEDSAFAAEQGTRPNHYPLVTRAGTVPVNELSERGLFSQARYRATYAIGEFSEPGYAVADYDPDAPEPRFESRDEAVPAGEPAPAAEPAQVADTGEARMIDVSAELAMR